MSNKFFLKKTWVNVDVCVEDYYNSGTTLEQVKEKINWSPYSNIISKDKKSDSEKSTNKKVSFEDYKAE